MKGFEPSFLDKLFDDEPRTPVASALRRLSLEELRERRPQLHLVGEPGYIPDFVFRGVTELPVAS